MIKESAPKSEERIRYGMPTLYQKENLVHFAANKKHIRFYPSPSGVENFKKELADYKTSKGAIQFPYTKTIPYDLIKKITQFRVKKSKINS
ncbi:hypothetical protein ALNOE001_12810 [Candidatus Methanobinarius endosymbioticus]|uniref:YdhG-like domain-containing protein n=1 Tax=Candidatus Methanobinarius endosymbioticus TaxID=2006182 RepID=A0A366MA07_9EURY|nr:hypothetical protein ALNOE001_12810 [Candidatus Methanobinarius endosymbioticus]